ncbi:MAG: hypothetical protein C0446_08340 [Chitinophaga sp.]|nr:hypothetical protein [Chitinophaga sp.]
MARIPRYISESATPASINTVQVDPSVAAAPFRAAEQSAANITNAIQGVLHGIGQDLAAREAEERKIAEKNAKIQADLYKAQATSDMSIFAAKAYEDARSSADGINNFASSFDKQFMEQAAKAIHNAPTQESQIDMIQKLSSMRAAIYTKASKESRNINNQINMGKLESGLQQFENLAAQNPESIDEVKQNASQLMEGMRKLGVPGHLVDKIGTKFNSKAEFQAARGAILSDPFAADELIKSGKFSNLSSGQIINLQNLAKSSTSAFKRETTSAVKNIESAILSGQPIPGNVDDLFLALDRSGDTQTATDLEEMLNVRSLLVNADRGTMVETLRELSQQQASNPQLSPDKFKKITSMVEGHIKRIDNDTFAYAEQMGHFPTEKELVDFTQVAESDINRRKLRSLQIGEFYGTSAPGALKNSEVNQFIAQLKNLPTDLKIQAMANINRFGESTINQVASAMKDKDPGLAQLFRMSSEDPEKAKIILKGKEVLGAKLYKPETNATKEILESSTFRQLHGDEKVKQSMIQAAKAYQAAKAVSGDELDFKEAFLEANNLVEMRDSTGILFGNKYMTKAPKAGMTGSDINDLVNSKLTSPEAWAQIGNGKPASADGKTPLQFNRIRPSEFTYNSNINGTWDVMYKGKSVMTTEGRPLTINLSKLI